MLEIRKFLFQLNIYYLASIIKLSGNALLTVNVFILIKKRQEENQTVAKIDSKFILEKFQMFSTKNKHISAASVTSKLILCFCK